PSVPSSSRFDTVRAPPPGRRILHGERMKSFLLVCSILALLTFTACGGGTSSSTTPPPPQTYTISVSVTGLTGGSLVLQNNGGNDLTITADGTFAFAGTLNSGAAYNIAVKTQPSGQTCSLGNNSTGTATSNVTVAITCGAGSNTFSISVAVSGLSGGSLVVQASSTDQLTFSSNGTQTFATKYASGATYAVTLVSQPPSQTCTPSSNITGTITANVTITINCVAGVSTDTLSASVTGLSGTLVLHDSQGDTLTFTTNNVAQTFAKTYQN